MHVLLAAHPEPDAPPHVLVVAAHTDSPNRPFDMTCWVVGCGCGDSFPLAPVAPSEAMRALAAVVSHGAEGANGGLASPESAAQLLRDHPPAPGESGGALSGSQSVSAHAVPGPIASAGSVTEPRRTGSDPGTFEIVRDGGGFSWRLRDQHGDELAVGKVYDTAGEARTAVGAVVRACGGDPAAAHVVEVAR